MINLLENYRETERGEEGERKRGEKVGERGGERGEREGGRERGERDLNSLILLTDLKLVLAVWALAVWA